MQNNLSIERSKQEQSAQTTKIKPKWHMTVLHVVYYLIMIAFLVFYMLPFWGTVMTSFKSNSEVMTTTPITPPSEWTMEGYESAMEELAQPLMTSLLVTLFGAAGSVFLGSICAYALSKWKFRFNNVFFIALVAATYLPFQAILIPLLQTINALDLYDNLWGLVLVHAVFGMPMCTVMMRGYYADVPDALIRQAMTVGRICSKQLPTRCRLSPTAHGVHRVFSGQERNGMAARMAKRRIAIATSCRLGGKPRARIPFPMTRPNRR